MQNVGSLMLTAGWLLLAAYLIVLIAVSSVIWAYEILKSWWQAAAAWMPLAHTQEVDHT